MKLEALRRELRRVLRLPKSKRTLEDAKFLQKVREDHEDRAWEYFDIYGEIPCDRGGNYIEPTQVFITAYGITMCWRDDGNNNTADVAWEDLLGEDW